ncbi:lysylphosphatidylglycerol synthase transmembrane domain-containing protein [Marinobacter sp.]|uniref:lysylphosphatidylglycerol synthase transmembrane domain-containing protein n=1 Tax=Marinobacter sp. TaxID=50741 RepID=UPI0035617440
MTIRGRGLSPVLRWGLTLLLLVTVLWLVDPAAVGGQLQNVHGPWLLAALVITPFQVVISAWRWQFTVRRLGGQLPLGYAIGEYYLGTLVNQLVPGGVVGDAGRALRHRQRMKTTTLAVHGVMIERLSGQLVLFLLAAVLAAAWLPLPKPPMPGLFLLPGVLIVILLTWSLFQAPPLANWWAGFQADVRRALLSRSALPLQLASSLAVIVSYLAAFWCLAMGLGLSVAVDAPGLLLALCTVLLMAMVIPLTVSGWGIRESAAAVLWPLAGMDAEQGVALAVSYGVLVLVSALPGVFFLFSGGRQTPGRTAYQCPD